MNQLNQPIGPDGVSTITLVGLHQRQAIDEKTAEPFMRKVMLTVYPALKSLDDTAQNTVDSAASLGTAALIATGAAPIGLINVAFETVFRSHWVPVTSKAIKVRDWVVPGSFTGALSVDLTGGGTVTVIDKPDTKDVRRMVHPPPPRVRRSPVAVGGSGARSGQTHLPLDPGRLRALRERHRA